MTLKIYGLTNDFQGKPYSTDTLLEHYSRILTDQTIEQIKHLGVDNRYFSNDINCYGGDMRKNDSIHDACVVAGQKCLDKLNLSECDIENLVVASEISEYQSPALAGTLIPSLKLDKFIKYFNLQGTACSSMPKTLELCQHLRGKTLVIISGITSDIYQRTLHKIKNKVEQKSQEWINTMFGFLFGDGVSSFVTYAGDDWFLKGVIYKINNITHGVNFEELDYKKASIRLNEGYELHASKDITKIALTYTDKVLAKTGIKNLTQYKRILLHTGSQKIIDAFKDRYDLTPEQIDGSRHILKNYGNLTGCSLPNVLGTQDWEGKSLMIGISMGFSLDVVEISI